MKIREITESVESYQLDEGLGDWIEKKMDDLLGNKYNDYGRWKNIEPLPKLPDDIEQKMVDDFLKRRENEIALERAARARGTTAEKLKPVLRYFVGTFIEKWRRIPQQDKQRFWIDLAKGVLNLLTFILKAMAKK